MQIVAAWFGQSSPLAVGVPALMVTQYHRHTCRLQDLNCRQLVFPYITAGRKKRLVLEAQLLVPPVPCHHFLVQETDGVKQVAAAEQAAHAN